MVIIKKLLEYSVQFENGSAVRNTGTLLVNDGVMDSKVRIQFDAYGKMFFQLWNDRYNIENMTGDLYNPVFEVVKPFTLDDILRGCVNDTFSLKAA